MEPILQIITNVDVPAIRVFYEAWRLVVTHPDYYVTFNEATTYPSYWSVIYATALILLSWASFIGFQTCIVIRRTPIYILAGADSKVVSDVLINEHKPTLKDTKGWSICKIQSANKIFFASSGIGRGPSFDVDAIATQACSEATSIQQATDNFKEIASDPLGKAIATTRTHWPEYFRRKYVESDALRIAFFGMEQRTPTVCVLMFKAVPTSTNTFRLDYRHGSCPGTIPEDKILVFVLGQTDASAEYQDDEKLWNSNPIRAIKRIILAEAKARPDTVAPPIDILRIDAIGPHWVEVKPECRKQKTK